MKVRDSSSKFKKIILLLLIADMSVVHSPFSVSANQQSGQSPRTRESYRSTSVQTNIGGGYAVTKQIENASFNPILLDKLVDYSIDANCILCDKKGYIWIGTYSGVMRYDGSGIEMADATKGFTSARTMFEDREGRLWFGTNGDGVVVYKNNDDIKHYGFSEGLKSTSIRSFADDNRKNVYIGTTEGVYYADKDLNFYQVKDSRIRHQRILGLSSDGREKVYGYTKGGDVFKIENGEVTAFYPNKDLGSATISSIYADKNADGKVYIGTGEGNLYYGTFGDRLYEMDRTYADGLGSIKWITRACNRIWLASSENIGYINEYNKFVLLENLPMNSAIEMIISDYQGNIWVCSSRQGLMKIVTSNFMNMNSRVGIKGELSSANCVIDDRLYIGGDNGVSVINLRSLTLIKNHPLTEYVGQNRIRCLRKDSNDNLWISTYNRNIGLVRYSRSGDITNFTVDDGIPHSEIRNSFETTDGTILVGTSGGMAVIKGDRVVKTYTEDDGLVDPVILSVGEGLSGEYYLGTDGGGVFVIKNDEISHLGFEDGLTSMVVPRIKADSRNGVVWIFTSNSIEYLKDGVMTNITTYPFTGAFDIFFGKGDRYGRNGTAWIMSAYGLCRLYTDELLTNHIEEYKLYTVDNGLTSTPTRNGYNDMAEDGNLFISAANGVNRVNIWNYSDGNPYIKTDIKAVYCDDIPLSPEPDGSYIISPRVDRIRIVPAIMDYTLNNPIVHLELEGANDVGITNLRSNILSLEYTDLKYGSYKAHFQIWDSKTLDVIQDDTYTFIKQPRLVERLSVRIIATIVLMSIVAFIVFAVLRFTIIRRQYKEIAVARDDAERASTAKSRFLANMSHEIRTPINTIMGMDEMLLREAHENVPEDYYSAVITYGVNIKNAAESLLGLINDVLDISKIESGKMHLVEQEYDTAEGLRAIVNMIRVKSSEKDLFFDVKIDEKLPKRLYGDTGKIKQIILNLLTNAVKYTEKGGFTLTVSVTAVDKDKCSLRYSVKDTGIGVRQDSMDKLFSAYERLDEEKNSGIQGTGLGLEISRRFAELMNGCLWCESTYGEGSDFILTIDQKIIDPEPIGEFREHEDAADIGPYVPTFVATRAKILVVDDNPMNLTVAKGLLSATRAQVTTADSGQQCLDLMEKEDFHIVLLDHMMPEMDGIETLARIREKYPEQIVFALTANVEPAGTDFYVSHGFNGYLSKPIDCKLLEKTLYENLPKDIIEISNLEAPAEKEEEFTGEYAFLREVEGISLQDGIRASGGYSLFIKSLKMFANTIDTNSEVLQKAFDEGDIELYTIKVHALKSSARIIGALGLGSAAEKLEMAGKSGDTEYIEKNHEALIREYLSYKEALSKLMEKTEEEAPDKAPIPENELADAYAALREIVPQMDYDATEMIINQVTAYKLPKEDQERFEEIKKSLIMFDWTKIEEIISGDK